MSDSPPASRGPLASAPASPSGPMFWHSKSHLVPAAACVTNHASCARTIAASVRSRA
jgi:hypothetical protein